MASVRVRSKELAFERKELIVYINGQFQPESNAGISPFDHGFLYGDAVWDACRCYRGYIFKLDKHIDRFFGSAKALGIVLPVTKSELRDAIVETVRRNQTKDAYIRFVGTVGVGAGVGMRSTIRTKPQLVILVVPDTGYTRALDGKKALV